MHGEKNLSGLDLSGTTHTDAKDYMGDTWKFSNPNYNDQSDQVEDIIEAASADCNSIDGWTGIYNEAAHGVVGTCYGVKGEDLGGDVDRGFELYRGRLL